MDSRDILDDGLNNIDLGLYADDYGWLVSENTIFSSTDSDPAIFSENTPISSSVESAADRLVTPIEVSSEEAPDQKPNTNCRLKRKRDEDDDSNKRPEKVSKNFLNTSFFNPLKKADRDRILEEQERKHKKQMNELQCENNSLKLQLRSASTLNAWSVNETNPKYHSLASENMRLKAHIEYLELVVRLLRGVQQQSQPVIQQHNQEVKYSAAPKPSRFYLTSIWGGMYLPVNNFVMPQASDTPFLPSSNRS